MNPKSLLLGVLLVLCSLSAAAQDLEGFVGIRFRFEAPGARAAGMGGTAEALSDAFTGINNPASLARIRQRTINVDARRSLDRTTYINGGTLGAFETRDAEAAASGIRGAMVILPTRHATWALFIDEPLHGTAPGFPTIYYNGPWLHVGIRDGELIPVEQCTFEQKCAVGGYNLPIALNANSRVVLRRLGTAAGFQIGALSLGGSVHYAELDEDTRTYFTRHTAHDRRVTWNAGAQYQLTPSIRAGASYRSGAKFDAQSTDVQSTVRTTFNTPTSYGGGVALDIAPYLTVAFDAQRIRYSEMLGGIPSAGIETSAYVIPLVMPDVTELHAGAEYRVPARLPIAIRAGWWRDPSHRLRAVNPPVVADREFFIPPEFFNLMLLDEDEDHVTAGIGVGERIRVDAAVDRSNHTTRASLTVATKF